MILKIMGQTEPEKLTISKLVYSAFMVSIVTLYGTLMSSVYFSLVYKS